MPGATIDTAHITALSVDRLWLQDVGGGGIYNYWSETQDTLNISSSNIINGDSLLFISDTLTMCELEFTLRLTGGSTEYTDNSATDTIFIKTYAEGEAVNVGYFENAAFTGNWTAPKFSSGIVTTQLTDGKYYWLDIPASKLTGGDYTYILYFTKRKYE